MSYGLQLLNTVEGSVLAMDAPAYRVTRDVTLIGGTSNGLTAIAVPTNAVVAIGYAGYAARAQIGVHADSGYLMLASTDTVRVLIAEPTTGNHDHDFGLNIYLQDGSLAFSSLDPMLITESVITQSITGWLTGTEHPSCSNVYSVPHEAGALFMTAGIPNFIAAREYDYAYANSVGLAYDISHTHIGFSELVGVDVMDIGPVQTHFTVSTARFYA